MAFKTTRNRRATRRPIVRYLIAATLTLAAVPIATASGLMAQVKAPAKNHLSSHAKHSTHHAAPAASAAPAQDVHPFAIGADGSVLSQLLGLQVDPGDAQAAADAVVQAMGLLDGKPASSARAVLQPQGAGQPKRLVALQLYSATSLAVELKRSGERSFAFRLAPGASEPEDGRASGAPSTVAASGAPATNVAASSAPTPVAASGAPPSAVAATGAPATAVAPTVDHTGTLAPTGDAASAVPAGDNARALAAGSVGLIKASYSNLAQSLAPVGAAPSSLRDLTQALAGFASNAARVDILKGKTADGTPHVLAASVGEGKSKRFFWWFAPPDQPEGWFDDQGRRVGGSVLAEPKPEARISSPFGTRRYYGRRTSSAFHNGIDFEGRTGDPIYAAADGVINHQGWYFNYGRTVKITHADGFETLYAHMSRFPDGIGPGSRVHKGDVIGYVGASGRSTGSHLHFSVIVNGQFVDPAPYIANRSGGGMLAGAALVAFRQWQQGLRKAAAETEQGGSQLFRFLQRPPANPFAQQM